MKNLKPRNRPTPTEALAIVAGTAPTLPPTQMPVSDKAATLNMRLRETTISAITIAAKEKGVTIKQLIVQALADAGVVVAPADLEDRTPRRRQHQPR